jgi:hypothetical protein
MPYTTVQICNMAIARIGQQKYIESITENSKAAELCNQFFDHARDATLSECEWPIANAYQTLTLIQQDPNPDWGYEYATPPDMLRARRISPGTGIRQEGEPFPFTIAENNGKVIWTDQDPAVLQYTKRLTDPTLFSPEFAEAMAWRLAVELAMPMAESQSLRDQMLQNFVVAVQTAGAAALNEPVVEDRPDGQFVRERGFSGETSHLEYP